MLPNLLNYIKNNLYIVLPAITISYFAKKTCREKCALFVKLALFCKAVKIIYDYSSVIKSCIDFDGEDDVELAVRRLPQVNIAQIEDLKPQAVDFIQASKTMHAEIRRNYKAELSQVDRQVKKIGCIPEEPGWKILCQKRIVSNQQDSNMNFHLMERDLIIANKYRLSERKLVAIDDCQKEYPIARQSKEVTSFVTMTRNKIAVYSCMPF